MDTTAVLIDDEISNLNGLAQKIETYFPKIKILAKFQKPEDAITYLNNEEPDLVFLDIQMPRINGFDLLSQIQEVNFQVIFVTAYSEFALEAFKKNAIDYVLKPIDNQDLKIAVNKAIQLLNSQEDLKRSENLVNLLSTSSISTNKICVPTTKGISFIPENEVLHLEGYEGYTRIHLVNNTIITSSYNLGKFEKVIGTVFFKCHKSHIISLDKVRHFENEGYLILENDSRVPISRSKRKEFLNMYN